MSRTRGAIREDILRELALARTMGGDMLSPSWLNCEYLPSLSLKETGLFDEAVGEMVDEGIIEFAGGEPPVYRLTGKGLRYIG